MSTQLWFQVIPCMLLRDGRQSSKRNHFKETSPFLSNSGRRKGTENSCFEQFDFEYYATENKF